MPEPFRIQQPPFVPEDAPRWKAAVDALGWYFKMELAPGIVTGGHVDVSSPEKARAHADAYGFPPSLRGKTVLDIGSADGFFAFEAERRGAARVVSLDVGRPLLMDFGPQGFRREFARAAVLGHQSAMRYDVPAAMLDEWVEHWERSIDSHLSFYFARAILGSNVERLTLELSQLSPERIGAKFDVVFCFGVLYHLRDPLGALERVAAITREYALINSALADQHFPDEKIPEDRPYARYVPAGECFGDHTYWWLPNLACLEAWVASSGFKRVERVPVNKNLVRAFV